MSAMTTNPEVEQMKAQLAEASAQLERWERQLATSDERFTAAEAAGDRLKADEIRQSAGSLPEGIHRRRLEVERLQKQLDLRSARLRTAGPADSRKADSGAAHGDVLNEERNPKS